MPPDGTDPAPDPAAEVMAEVMAELLAFISSVVLHNTEVGRRLGLGPSDAQFLSLLGAHGPLTPGDLARHSGLTTGTVTGVLDRLEAGGYVRRERDPHDRRRVVVVPVPEGTQRLRAEYAGHARRTDEVLGRRTAAELAVIRDFLRELND